MRSLTIATGFVCLSTMASCSGRVEPVSEVRSDGGGAAADDPLEFAAEDWPVWRGATGDGHVDGEPTADWHVVWEQPVPGLGHSSPVVAGGTIYITTADESDETQRVLAYDADTGSLQWDEQIHQGNLMKRYSTNSQASATVAFDGTRVIAAFINDDKLWVTALGLDGKQEWQESPGPFQSEHGYGASPALYRGLVIVSGDNQGGSYVAALNRADGELVWRTAREPVGRHASYATPMVFHVAGRDQLILAGFERVTSYDPATGEELWWCDGPTEVMANTPVVWNDMVFVSGGYPDKSILAIGADGAGDVTGSHLVWKSNRGVTYVPSPIVHGDNLFIVNDSGIASCFGASDGTQHWQKRLGGKFTSSPISVGDSLFAVSESGTLHVLAANAEYDVIGETRLPGSHYATPVVSGDRLYARSKNALLCLAPDEMQTADSSKAAAERR